MRSQKVYVMLSEGELRAAFVAPEDTAADPGSEGTGRELGREANLFHHIQRVLQAKSQRQAGR